MKKCLYCENKQENFHFESSCCDRGMCDDCYAEEADHEQQMQVSGSGEDIKPEYQSAGYLCFECVDVWQVINNK